MSAPTSEILLAYSVDLESAREHAFAATACKRLSAIGLSKRLVQFTHALGLQNFLGGHV